MTKLVLGPQAETYLKFQIDSKDNAETAPTRILRARALYRGSNRPLLDGDGGAIGDHGIEHAPFTRCRRGLPHSAAIGPHARGHRRSVLSRECRTRTSGTGGSEH